MTENERRIQDEYTKWDRYVDVSKSNLEFEEHFDKWNYMDFDKTLNENLHTPGQIFLYENITSNYHVYYPKMSVYLNTLPCDQTIEYECFDFRRTWEYTTSFKLINNVGREYETMMGEQPSLLQSHIQWSNYIMIYGVWNSKPSWREMRRAYEETWWFHKTKQEKRNNKLNKIINGYN